MQKRLNSVEFVCNGWADREKWPQFSTLLISFSSYESEAMGKALAFSKGNTDFLNLKQGLGIGIFWQLPFFAENQTRVCSVRGGGGGGGQLCFNADILIVCQLNDLPYMSDEYMASTKGTLRKSTVLVFLYCFEKASNLFNSGKRHSLQLSRLISPQNVISQGTVSF